MWLAETEGAKFWLSVLTELKNRGLQDILVACVDWLKGFSEAIAAEYPETKVQLCIVHMVRNSLKHASCKEYKLWQSLAEAAVRAALERFAEQWGEQYPQGHQAAQGTLYR